MVHKSNMEGNDGRYNKTPTDIKCPKCKHHKSWNMLNSGDYKCTKCGHRFTQT